MKKQIKPRPGLKFASVLLLVAGGFHCSLAYPQTAPYIITGRVTDDNGHPLNDAKVFWFNTSAKKDGREAFPQGTLPEPQGTIVSTDKDGRYSLAASEAGPDYVLAVIAPGWATGWKRYLTFQQPGEKTSFDFRLPPEAVIEGRVTDESDNPLKKAELSVLLKIVGPPAPNLDLFGYVTGRMIQFRTETNDEGRFRIRGFPVGFEADTIWAPSLGRGPRYKARAGRAINKNYKMEFEESDPAGAWGIVVDSVTQNPIQAFTVRVQAKDYPFASQDGRFWVDLPRFVGQSGSVRAEGYRPWAGNLPREGGPNNTKKIIALAPGKPMRTVVVDRESRLPLAGATIKFTGRGDENYEARGGSSITGPISFGDFISVETAADGSVTFIDHDPPFTLSVSAPGHAFISVRPEDRVTDQSTDTLRIELDADCVFRGILRAGGRPLLGVRIEGTITDENGKFQITGKMAGQYTFRANLDDGIIPNVKHMETNWSYTVAPGSEKVIPLDLDLGPYTIQGETRVGGKLQGWMAVRIIASTRNAPISLIDIWSDARGHYSFKGLRAGTYQINLPPPNGMSNYIPMMYRQFQINGDTTLNFDLMTMRTTPAPSPAPSGKPLS